MENKGNSFWFCYYYLNRFVTTNIIWFIGVPLYPLVYNYNIQKRTNLQGTSARQGHLGQYDRRMKKERPVGSYRGRKYIGWA